MNDFLAVAGVIVLVLVVMIGLAIGLSIISSHYEAEAFNRVTGANVTASDAFWLDLRVELPPKE